MGFDKSKLNITKAPFDDAFDLQDSIASALKGNGISMDSGEDVLNSDVSGFIDAALSTISNKSVRENLFRCANRATYDNNVINKDFFEKEENRELYYPIMIEIIKENVGPFMRGLLSMFGGLGVNLERLLKQK